MQHLSRATRAFLAIPLVLALVVILPAPATAQGEALGVRVIEDPSGDVALRTPAGTPVPASTDRNKFLDVLAVDLEEQPDGYFVHLWVAGVPPEPRAPFVDEGFHSIRFLHGDMPYEVGFQILQGQIAWLGSDPSGSGEYDFVTELEMSVDAGAGHLQTFVPRPMLADRDGAPPFPGRVLTGFSALGRGPGIASDMSIMGQEIDMGTYGQDEAAAPAGFGLPVRFGVAQSGDAQLSSPRPFRASNGEAATFIFEATASNFGPDERLYRLEAVGVPAGWQVTFPDPQVRLGGTDAQDIAILASVPFAHQHGRVSSFIVEMRDLADPASVGRVELGLHYTDPAQPAGHHSELYLHSTAMGELESALAVTLAGFHRAATMNTNPEDPKDDAVDLTGSWASFDIDGRTMWTWDVHLSPHLAMGLDVDLLRQGTISIPVATTVPITAAHLEGAIYAARSVEDFSEEVDGVLLATIPPSAQTDLMPATTHTFESTIVPQESGDYVPYDPELNLVLVLNLSGGRFATPSGPEAPVLKPGGRLTLPLLEYADPVDDLFATAGGLELDLVEGAERRAPPGGSAIVTVRAFGAPGHYALRALGIQADWVHTPDGLHIGDDGTGEARVAVHVPADARAGDVVDLVLEASGGPDEAVRSLARLRLTVDPEAPDGGHLAPGSDGKGAPAPGAALLVLALLAVLAVSRRRQR